MDVEARTANRRLGAMTAVACGIGVLVGAGVLQTSGLPVGVSAQEPDPSIAKMGAALFELEGETAEMGWLAADWALHYSSWASRVEAAATPRDFVQLLRELEGAVTWHANHDWWHARRLVWRTRARSASTVADWQLLYIELLAGLMKQTDIYDESLCP